MALQVTCGPGPVRQEGSELPRCVTARMCAPVVPATVASGHFEIVTKTFAAFWEDFKAKDRFDSARDALLLVTLRGTQTLLNGLGGLLECARNSSDEDDFANRLTLPGHLSQRAKDYSSVIRSIVERAEPGCALTREEFWRFLKVIHILPLDFTTSTSQQEAWIKQALALASTTENGHVHCRADVA